MRVSRTFYFQISKVQTFFKQNYLKYENLRHYSIVHTIQVVFYNTAKFNVHEYLHYYNYTIIILITDNNYGS